MPDIAKCVNDRCPSMTSCYRFMVVSSGKGQSFVLYEFDPKTGKCDAFEEIWDKREKRGQLSKR